MHNETGNNGKYAVIQEVYALVRNEYMHKNSEYSGKECKNIPRAEIKRISSKDKNCQI
jgi:hypothetical protein